MTLAATLEIEPLNSANADAEEAAIAVISINRPEAANAFNADVMNLITGHLSKIASNPSVRALVVRGKGKHFSAGADLSWMQESAKLSLSENITDSKKLTAMFEALANLDVPTIAVVKGAAYGGAVGLTAACDFVIATDTARFCLSEVKLGLLPAVILPYLARKMPSGDLKRFALSARVFGADEAKESNLVQRVCGAEEINDVLRDELSYILKSGPQAQARLKKLFRETNEQNNKQGDYTVKEIAEARSGEEGQQGLSAFFDKSTPPWSLSLPEDWTLNDA